MLPNFEIWFRPRSLENAVKVMLENDPGKPRLDHLRGIHLLEVDYNFMMKLIWERHLVRRAAQLGFLMPTQQARPGYMAISTVLNKALT